jgi:hypothetical protein
MVDVPCIHLNAAGAALPLPAAQSAAIEFMREEFRLGPHWAAEKVSEKIAGRQEGATVNAIRFGMHQWAAESL